MMLAIPKISIITVTLNAGRYLEKAISSVIEQTYSNIEYIVIDGGSNDSSITIIKKYQRHIDKWISEPDDGIADAMNKGLGFASGDYILFLHSDDYLLTASSLQEASDHFCNVDIHMFQIFQKRNGGRELRTSRGLTSWLKLKNGIFHQGVLCSSNLFKKIGCFDCSLKIAMDYDFFYRAYNIGATYKCICEPLTVMRMVGISSRLDWNSLLVRFQEERRVHLKNCSGLYLRIIYPIYWFLYPMYRKFRYILDNKV